MGQKFIITESERERIKSLYEQQTKPLQDISKLFTQEEIENGHQLYMQKDKFNGQIYIQGGGWLTFSKTIKGGSINYTFSIQAPGRGYAGMKGVFLLFEDGTKLLKPNAYVKSTYNRGFVLEGYITNLTQGEINLFKTKKLQTYKVSNSQEDLEDFYGVDLMKDANLISKITAQNFDSVKSLFDKNDPLKNYNYEEDEKSSEESTVKNVEDVNKVYTGTEVEMPAEFPGGSVGWGRYIGNSLNNNILQQNNAPDGKYSVKLSFNVGKDGSISDVVAENDPGYGTKEEAVRVVKLGPKWKPAVQNGRSVNYRHKIIINFIK